MKLRMVWAQLHPGQRWPGEDEAVESLVADLMALRLLTRELMDASLANADPQPKEDGKPIRSRDEIQRAHDLVGMYAVLTNDASIMEHVSALCWVLGHDHNTAFPQILEMVEQHMRERGIEVVRLPQMVDPREGL